MAESAKWLYGRVHAGVDGNAALVQGVEAPVNNIAGSSKNGGVRMNSTSEEEDFHNALEQQSPSDSSLTPTTSRLLSLPPEILHQILTHLSPATLLHTSLTCRLLHTASASDLLWHRHLLEHVQHPPSSPSPYPTFRALYLSLLPYWFLPQHALWFGTHRHVGKLLIAHFSPNTSEIRAHRVVAAREPPAYEHWEHDDEVLVHLFRPTTRLHLDHPTVILPGIMSDIVGPRPNRYATEVEMPTQQLTKFALARTVPPYDGMSTWPHPNIPSSSRVRAESQNAFTGAGHRPRTLEQVCNTAFRLRERAHPRLGSEIETYSTVDPYWYTPTPTKPWRGIWVGDYSGHGCEFLLVHQPDDEDEVECERLFDESEEAFAKRRDAERSCRGRLEAIKLTGDINIPRGEYTFVADDLGPAGLVRVAEEEQFKGARIVKSRGHIAERNFIRDKYIESQLILISHNRLAQYWVGFGHISFYERVDVGKLMRDPKCAVGPVDGYMAV